MNTHTCPRVGVLEGGVPRLGVLLQTGVLTQEGWRTPGWGPSRVDVPQVGGPHPGGAMSYRVEVLQGGDPSGLRGVLQGAVLQ